MADDWQAGDLALCVRAGMCPIRHEVAAFHEGAVYTVTRVVPTSDLLGRPRVALALEGFPQTSGFNSICFRKIRPHSPDAEDLRTIALMRGKREPANA